VVELWHGGGGSLKEKGGRQSHHISVTPTYPSYLFVFLRLLAGRARSL
jgi:hypothetical protein